MVLTLIILFAVLSGMDRAGADLRLSGDRREATPRFTIKPQLR